MSDQASVSSPLGAARGSGASGRDWLGFGHDTEFQPRRVAEWLELSSTEVSRLVDFPSGAACYDDAIPAPMRDRLIEVAATCNLVADIFVGDLEKARKWFRAPNSMLGDVAPRDMIRLGRFDRLRKFILSSSCGQ